MLPGLKSSAAVSLCLVLLFPVQIVAAADYYLARPEVRLDLQREFEDEERTSATVGDRSEETDLFRQRLNVDGTGWWYHPEFVSFTYSLEPEWRQEDTSSNDDFDRDDDITFFGYFLDARFLKSKPQSAGLFLRQSRNTFDSTLSPSNVTETNIARATWQLKEYLLPTNFTVERNDSKFEDLFPTRDKSDIFRVDSRHDTDRSRSNIRAEFVNQDRRIGVSETETDRLLINASNTFNFSDNFRLLSSFSGIDSKSDQIDSSAYFLSERVLLEHGPSLRSDHELRVDKRENAGSDSRATLLSSSVQHFLYENLTSTARAQLSRDDFDNGQLDVFETGIDLRYTRRIPQGRINAETGYSYRYEDNDFDSRSGLKTDEVLSVTGVELLFLQEVNVVVDSIVVTDATASIVYVEDLDYVVVTIGSSVAIEPTLFGGIADRQVLLVDYRFITQSPFTSDRNQVFFGASLDLWRALRVFYNVNRSKENLRSGIRPSDLIDDKIQRYGLALRYRWSTTRLEVEKRDTIRVPLERFRASESLIFQLTNRFSLGVSASYTDTNFKDEGEGSDTRSVDLGANLRWNLGRWGRFEVRAFSREVDGSSQESRFDGLIGLWGWRYGDWAGSVRYETIDESDDLTLQSRNRDVFTINVSRLFR